MRIRHKQRRAAKIYPARRYTARLIDGLVLTIAIVPIWEIMYNVFQRDAVMHASFVSLKAVWLLVTDGWGGARSAAIDGIRESLAGLVQFIVITLALAVAMMALYEWLAHAWFGRTLGKAVVGIKVVNLSCSTQPESTQKLSVGQSARRAVVTVLLPGAGWVVLVIAASSLDPVIALAGIVLSLSYWIDIAALLFPYDGRRRCLHDLVSGGIVVPANYGNHRHATAERSTLNS